MSVRSDLIIACRKVYENKFVSAYDGNLSARIDEHRILITPSGKNKGELTESDLLEIDYNGNLLEGKAKVSTEAKLHLIVYKNRQEINSVVHGHPVYSTAFATIGEGFNRPVFPEVVLAFGKVPLCKYGTPSTDDLPNSILPHIDYAWAFLLENHGAVTIGKTIMGAYYRMEKLEHAAHTLYVARTMGREKSIPIYKLQELYSIAEKTYGIKIDKKSKFDF